MDENERIDRLRLIRTENVGPVTFRTLLQHYGSAGNALEHLPDIAHRGGRRNALSVYSRRDALRETEEHDKIGARLIMDEDAEYPDLLREIPDAPPVLSVYGNIELLKTPYIAMVGTRNASINGKNIARRMANDLVAAGYGVVSGLALGIDAAAHEGAMYAASKQASTAAVLGTGVDIFYPETNKNLYFQIKEKGVLISEFPFGTKPQAFNFPRRNRIISGLARALVVIEATLRSGSLITANKALEQGREVMAVPGSPTDARSGGVNHLIKNGAPLVESARDVLDLLSEMPLLTLCETEKNDSPAADRYDFEEPETDVSSKDLLEKMGTDPVTVDTLVTETGLPAGAISVLLVELELAGKIERLPGGRVIRVSDF